MDDILVNVNWVSVVVGAVAAFGLGMVWFGMVFNKPWAKGSHNIEPPPKMPVAAMGLQLLGIFLLSWVIGATATIHALGTAIFILLALASLQAASSLFCQKFTAAAMIDGDFIFVAGGVMIAAQGLL